MVKTNSLEIYLTNLISVMKKADTENAEELLDYIMKQPTKLRTKHNYLNSIVSVAKHKPNFLKGDISRVKDERDKLQGEINAVVKENNVTDKQKEVMNAIKWQDIVDLTETLREDRDKSPKALEDYLLVALMNPPLRNDLQDVRITRNGRDCQDNCIWLPKGKKKTATLYIRDHKTTSRGGKPIIRKLDAELTADLNNLAKDGRSHLFKDRSGKPYTSSSFTHRLNSIFKKHLGFNISSTLLRKLYLTDKYKDYKKVQREMAKDADQMGHSVGTQQEHYVNSD